MKFVLGMVVGAALAVYLTADVSVVVIRDVSAYNHDADDLGQLDLGPGDTYSSPQKLE
ncbi:MAG TPA: hypothetical protein VGP13_02665 [Candidatus Paceibacterota bacterium]|jgi:hypothetical protein|nr:hypothetical protein [Candidatus Paceibacterota bacterium]